MVFRIQDKSTICGTLHEPRPRHLRQGPRQRHQRDRRDPDERRPDQVRDRQGDGSAFRRPIRLDGDALSVQLRLRPRYALRRRRSGRRPGDHALRAHAGRGGALPADRAPQDVGRGGRRHQGAVGADRQADAALSSHPDRPRPARDGALADHALLRALQGSRARQVGEGRRLGRPRGGEEGDRGGREAFQEGEIEEEMTAMELVRPALEHLASYRAALERGWSPDNIRGEAATREQLAEIARDSRAFVDRMIDREAKGPPIELLDGTIVGRIPGYTLWMWDGEFCGSINFRWQPGTSELPAHVLGHIGYAVVPWKRRLGYGTKALALMLIE